MELSHLSFITEDLEKSKAFYKSLGFEIIFQSKTAIQVKKDNINILLKTSGETTVHIAGYKNQEAFYRSPENIRYELTDRRINGYEWPPVIADTVIYSDIDTIWNTFVNIHGWDPWFTDGMTMQLQENGQMYIRWFKKTYGEEVIDYGIITGITPKKMLRFTWNKHEDIFLSDVIINFFEANTGGCWVYVFDETCISNEKDLKIKFDCAVGWGEMLTLAKLYIEKGIILY